MISSGVVQRGGRCLGSLRAAGTTFLLTILAITCTPEALAEGGVRVITNNGHKAKPTRYSSRWQGLFDETSYRASNLRWKRWGARKTTGRGRMKQCAIGEGGGRYCRHFSGFIVQFRNPINTSPCVDLPYRLYSKVRFRSYKGPWTDWLPAYHC